MGSLFFWPAPVLLKQGYLVVTGVVTAYMFTFVPEWTTWTLLIAMALYDLYAVLVPGGPLKVIQLLQIQVPASDVERNSNESWAVCVVGQAETGKALCAGACRACHGAGSGHSSAHLRRPLNSEARTNSLCFGPVLHCWACGCEAYLISLLVQLAERPHMMLKSCSF